jgi:hypothetical protein
LVRGIPQHLPESLEGDVAVTRMDAMLLFKIDKAFARRLKAAVAESAPNNIRGKARFTASDGVGRLGDCRCYCVVVGVERTSILMKWK